MSAYLITFLSVTVLYFASVTTSCYQENRLARRYELLRGITNFLALSVCLTFAWWFLERFFDGFDSGPGWWILAFALGKAIEALIDFATKRICRIIWTQNENKAITTIKLKKGIRTAFYFLMLIGSICLAVFFTYGLCASKFNDSIVLTIFAVLLDVLFLFGAYDSIKKICSHHS